MENITFCHRLSRLKKTFTDFFADPFRHNTLEPVPWARKDAVIVVLVSTVLFSALIFGGFFAGVKLVDLGLIQTPELMTELGLEISTQEAIDLDIIDGFGVMSLFLYEHLSIALVGGILIQVLLQLSLLYAYSRWKYGIHLTQLGFRTLPIKMLMPMVAMLFVLSVLIQNGVLGFYKILGIENAAGNGAAEQMIVQGTIPLPVLFVFAGIIAPILEEVIFRGFFLASSLKKSRVFSALTTSAIFFALAHLNPSILFPGIGEGGVAFSLPSLAELGSAMILMPIYFLLGMLLGFSFLKTRSLYPGIAFHMVNNTAALLLLLSHISAK